MGEMDGVPGSIKELERIDHVFETESGALVIQYRIGARILYPASWQVRARKAVQRFFRRLVPPPTLDEGGGEG